jgi:hypothetical protein
MVTRRESSLASEGSGAQAVAPRKRVDALDQIGRPARRSVVPVVAAPLDEHGRVLTRAHREERDIDDRRTQAPSVEGIPEGLDERWILHLIVRTGRVVNPGKPSVPTDTLPGHHGRPDASDVHTALMLERRLHTRPDHLGQIRQLAAEIISRTTAGSHASKATTSTSAGTPGI